MPVESQQSLSVFFRKTVHYKSSLCNNVTQKSVRKSVTLVNHFFVVNFRINLAYGKTHKQDPTQQVCCYELACCSQNPNMVDPTVIKKVGWKLRRRTKSLKGPLLYFFSLLYYRSQIYTEHVSEVFASKYQTNHALQHPIIPLFQPCFKSADSLSFTSDENKEPLSRSCWDSQQLLLKPSE